MNYWRIPNPINSTKSVGGWLQLFFSGDRSSVFGPHKMDLLTYSFQEVGIPKSSCSKAIDQHFWGIKEFWTKNRQTHQTHHLLFGLFQTVSTTETFLSLLFGGLEHLDYVSIYEGNVIIPIDELIFFRGVETTKITGKSHMSWENLWFPVKIFP